MSRISPWWSLAALALLAGCDTVKDKLDLPEPPKIDFTNFGLPKADNGLYELISAAGSSLQLDPTRKDPLTALARCADLVTYCYEGGGITLDACVQNARACTTNTPWEEAQDCCPTECADAYSARRQVGTEPIAAFEGAFFLEPHCFPGVMDAVGGTP